jgi:hypothetical protein
VWVMTEYDHSGRARGVVRHLKRPW